MKEDIKKEDWHSLEKQEIFDRFNTNEEGLANKKIPFLLEKYGKNEIKESYKIKPLVILLSQFKSLFILILISAAIFSFVIKHYLDFWVILAIVIINAIIGFVQEYKAERIISEMRNLLVPKVKVIRDNKVVEISSKELVPGDIILVSEGDKISADCRILISEDLEVNEAVLTGESFPQKKEDKKIRFDVIVNDRINMIYAGTGVSKGHGKAVVVATGMNTEFGKIANSVQTIKNTLTPLEKKINGLSKRIAIIAFILTILTIFIGIIKGRELTEMILTGVSLAISIIPEGLPAVISITLALAIKRMQKYHALIRKLPAAETLGRTTIICTDKTGTLTEENISVSDLYCNNQKFTLQEGVFYLNNKKISPTKYKTLTTLLKLGIFCNNSRIESEKGKLKLIGDSTENAIALSAYDAGLIKEKELKQQKRIKEYSFSSERKMMSIVREDKGRYINYVKGSPEVVLNHCKYELLNDRHILLNSSRKKEILEEYKLMGNKALRVLGFAFKEVPKKFNQEQVEDSLIFVGFQGMLDKPRKEIKQAIKECTKAGIKIKMITGDSEITAKAIAKMIGLNFESIEGKELERLSDIEFKKAVIEKDIFARITPQLKLRIVKELKNKGEIVAVTGDGINDVLALKEAHIGVAMGIRGTDATREISDIVLLDDNFNTIVYAVKEGRKIYDNLKKSIKAQLSANIDELFVILTAIIFSLPLPFLPLSILWMNLITDSLPAISLGVEKGDKDLMKRKPVESEDKMLKQIFPFAIIAGILSFIIAIVLFLSVYQIDLEKARTFALTASVFSELFVILSCRSEEKNIWKIDFFSNKLFIFAFVLTIILQLIAIYTPLSSILGVKEISFLEIIFLFIVSSIPFIFFEILKFFKIKI
jgi:Ca2+-transporting ATPase